MADILTLLDGGADVDAKSDGVAAEPLFTPGTGRLKRVKEQKRGAIRRWKESSREVAMRQYLTRKHHLLRALAVALFYEAFGVRVRGKCY